MPELPEVTTTVNGINKECQGWTIVDVWSDLPKKVQKIKHFQQTIKDEKFFKFFVQHTLNQKIIRAERRAKNILIFLANDYVILVHLKMTGHFVVGTYNHHIHLRFTLSKTNSKNSKTKYLSLSDTRKFAKVTIFKKADTLSHLADIGPEPLEQNFTYKTFIETLNKAKGLTRPIKTVLMDPATIAGIGNIYSDELLWRASVHPESRWKNIPKDKKLSIYKAMQKVLKAGIDFGGDSTSDYRNIYGERGSFQEKHNVYRLKGNKCKKSGCTGTITRKVISGRSAHFCNKHQKLFK